ncbi:baculoviral IAP repeat-containing protein 7 [Diachasmimorpha longicaudata]|uniref:baculoviral IAP repeat-containing protein 7 n=1 Tax=Diachasmimorpha longicaudata TaxID=58733 RepID=UPI0030B8E953
MNIEENRLRTFSDWPQDAAVNATRIAKGGFYYTGHSLEVQCFICGIRISDWNYGDQVMVRHRQAEPNCPFVRNPATTCNVPIVESLESITSQPTSSSRGSRGSDARGDGDQASWATTIVQSENPRVEYGSFAQRLTSFRNWPSTAAVTPEQLARAGFYYLQSEDMVECAFCRGIMRMWEVGEDPDVEHRIGFPHCDFYAQQESNSGLSTDKEELGNVKLLSAPAADLHRLGIQKHSAPRQPKHATYEGRLRTFQGWPENLRQTPEMLATAGFYYVASGDQVRCFHCDGGLHNWETDDDPWTEHARWFPKCGYVAMVRGQEFIRHCVDNRPPLDPLIFLGVAEDGEEDVTGTSMGSSRSSGSTSTSRSRPISDSQLEELLLSTPAIAALQIGLNVGRVKRALRERMETMGTPYTNADQLIEHVRHIHLNEESNGLDNNVESSSSELATLLSHVISVQSSSNRAPESARTNGKQNDMKFKKNSDQENRDDPGHSDDKSVQRKTENGMSDEPLSLEEENRRLREARLCKICMDREVSVVFLPCGHLATCIHCAPSLADCPMCRQEIRATVRTFLA